MHSFMMIMNIEYVQDGNYTLVSFSDSYEEYLKAMGVPWFALPLILRGTETLEIETTDEGARQVISTGFMSREHQFKWNTEWNSTFGNDLGTLWNNCTRDSFNIVVCR